MLGLKRKGLLSSVGLGITGVCSFVLWSVSRKHYEPPPLLSEKEKEKFLDGQPSDSHPKTLRLKCGRLMEYFEYGDKENGRPMLFIHGALSTGERFSVFDDFFTNNNIYAICPSLPGCGLSDAVPDRQIRAYPEDVKQLVVEHLNQPHFWICGLSYGGIHALACAALLPDNVQRVLLFGPQAPYKSKFDNEALCDPYQGQGWMYTVARYLGWSPFLWGLFGAYTAYKTSNPEKYTKSVLSQLTAEEKTKYREFTLPTGYDMFLTYSRSVTNSVRRSAYCYLEAARHVMYSPWGFSLKSIRQPVMIISGMNDGETPTRMQEHLRTLIPVCSLRRVTGSHYSVTILAFQDNVEEFLDWNPLPYPNPPS